MKDNDVNPQLNKDAAIMYFTYGQNNWYVLFLLVFPRLSLDELIY